jgi:hypothetical protein
VNKPQVGVRGARPSYDSVAVARMRCIRLMRVVVTAVMNKYLKRLKGIELDPVL